MTLFWHFLTHYILCHLIHPTVLCWSYIMFSRYLLWVLLCISMPVFASAGSTISCSLPWSFSTTDCYLGLDESTMNYSDTYYWKCQIINSFWSNFCEGTGVNGKSSSFMPLLRCMIHAFQGQTSGLCPCACSNVLDKAPVDWFSMYWLPRS